MKRTIFELISLFEIIILVGLFVFALVSKNIYLGILGLGVLSKQIPEKLIKRLNFPKRFRDRPAQAMNCGIINTGGSYDKKAGFPSGHTTMAWFLFMYTLLEYIRLKKEGRDLFMPLIFTSLLAVCIPIARVGLHCHTIPQIIGGIFLGSVWASLFYAFEQYFLIHQKRYQEDKDKIIDFLAR